MAGDGCSINATIFSWSLTGLGDCVDLLVTGAPSSGSGVIERIAQDFGFRSGDCVRFNDSWLNDLGGSWLAPPRTNEMTWHRLDHDRLFGSSKLLDCAGESAEPVVLADPR